jgi:hypothetical protein
MTTPKHPSNTGHLFARKPLVSKHELTRERLDADLDAFQAAGGVIEKLGNTCTLKKLGLIDGEAPPTTVQPVGKARSGAKR